MTEIPCQRQYTSLQGIPAILLLGAMLTNNFFMAGGTIIPALMVTMASFYLKVQRIKSSAALLTLAATACIILFLNVWLLS